MLHYVPMEQRASLDDLCAVHISRYRGNQILANMQTDGHGPQSQSLPLLAGHPSPHTESRAPRPPLPEPGCGCSVDGDMLPKPFRSGHRPRIPRPRTAFILFRCDFVHQRNMNPKEVENDHISRRAGRFWNQMTPEEKQPWVKMAEREKQRHATLYPNYKYTPNPTNFKFRRTKLKGHRSLPYKFLDPQAFDFVLPVDPRSHECGICGDGSDVTSSRDPATCQHLCSQQYLKRRPSSCPPIGATPVPDLDLLQSWLPPVVSQDDLHRRSSQATMYKSVAYPSVEPVVPNAHIPLPHRDDSWFGMPQPYLWELDDLDPSNSDFPLGFTLSEDNTVCPLLSQGENACLYGSSTSSSLTQRCHMITCVVWSL